MNPEEINKVIARVILSTKRKNRQYSLVEIASDIKNLVDSLGSMKEVSNLIGVSPGMLNQFLSVFKLPEITLESVKDRSIDSVSIVHSLSKFNKGDIVDLSTMVKSNRLNSQDLRALLPYRKQFPDKNIFTLIEEIKSSKNIRVSVIRILTEDTSKSVDELRSDFLKIIGEQNLNTIVKSGNHIDIKITKEGETILRKSARDNNLSLQQFISSLIC
jgi:hypothetical protein